MFHLIHELIHPDAARALGKALVALPEEQWEPGRSGSGEQAAAVKHPAIFVQIQIDVKSGN